MKRMFAISDYNSDNDESSISVKIIYTEEDAIREVAQLNLEGEEGCDYRYKEIQESEWFYPCLNYDDKFRLPSHISEFLQVEVNALMSLQEITNKLFEDKKNIRGSLVVFLKLPKDRKQPLSQSTLRGTILSARVLCVLSSAQLSIVGGITSRRTITMIQIAWNMTRNFYAATT